MFDAFLVIYKTARCVKCTGKTIERLKGLTRGLAHKANVDDDRESPSFKLMQLLEEKGSLVDYYDPYVPVIGNKRDYKQYTNKQGVNLSAEMLAEYDCVLIATNHDIVDYDLVRQHAQLIM